MPAAATKPAVVSVDDQFLKEFVANCGQAQTSNGSAVNAGNLDAFLDKVGSGSSTTTPAQQQLHAQAKAKGVADTSKEDAKAALKEQQRIEKLRIEDEEKRASAIQTGISAARSNIIEPVIERGGRAVDRIASLRTVGGIGLLVVILVLLLFVVIQVNSQGDTRIKQFWYMLNGRARLI